MELCSEAVPAAEHRPTALATGTVGDVYLCHPFLVHRAQPHRGREPRFMAQPPLHARTHFDLDEASPTPVARAVLNGLSR